MSGFYYESIRSHMVTIRQDFNADVKFLANPNDPDRFYETIYKLYSKEGWSAQKVYKRYVSYAFIDSKLCVFEFNTMVLNHLKETKFVAFDAKNPTLGVRIQTNGRPMRVPKNARDENIFSLSNPYVVSSIDLVYGSKQLWSHVSKDIAKLPKLQEIAEKLSMITEKEWLANNKRDRLRKKKELDKKAINGSNEFFEI